MSGVSEFAGLRMGRLRRVCALGSLGGRLLQVAACAVLVTGCAVSGHAFSSAGLNALVPGQTTLAQAIEAFNSAPVQQWPQPDGGLLARWGYGRSLSTDAIYFRQSVLLRFGPGGTFQAIEDTVNVPLVPSVATLQARAQQAGAGAAPAAETFSLPPDASAPGPWPRSPE